MKPRDVLAETGHDLAGARRLANVCRQVQRNFTNFAFFQQNTGRVPAREARVFGFIVAITDDLVAPFRLPPAAMLDVNLGLFAPDTYKLFSRGAQHICVNVALAVACV